MKRKQFPAGDDTGGPPTDSAASLYDSGLRHFRSGRYPIAEERMRRVLLLDPEHADALYLMGLLHARANKIDRAIDFVVRASRINQGNPEYFVSLGELLGSQDRFDEALKCYNVALKLKPDCADVWVKVGDLQRRQERFEEALFAYEHALVVDPRHLDAADKGGALLVELRRFDAAALALQAGRPDDAELACRQILRIVPTHDGSMNLLGIIALQRGKFALARDCLEKALAQDSQNSIYHANLAKVLVALACPSESESHFREALRLDAGNADALLGLGKSVSGPKACRRSVDLLFRALAFATR